MTKTKWYAKPIYVLFALVLVLSFSLVTAVPVSAYSVHNMSLDSNDSWTCEDADTLIRAKVAETGMSFDGAAASFASGNTNCEIKDLEVSGPAYVGQPVTVTGTVDMTAWVQCIGWNYYGVRVFAESLGYARVIDTGGSEVASVQSPWKWSDHWYGVDEHHWWFHVDTNDESQVWDFSITFTPTHTGEYTLFAGGRVNAGYWSDVDYFGEPWFPHPDPDDYGRGGGVTVSCQDSFPFEVVLEVDIDIKPGSDPNSINLGDQGVLPVAILGSSIDVSTIDLGKPITLGGTGVTSRGPAKAPKLAVSFEDVDGDGLMDLVAFFRVQDLVTSGALDKTTTELMLEAETTDDVPISGTDTVNIVPEGT